MLPRSIGAYQSQAWLDGPHHGGATAVAGAADEDSRRAGSRAAIERYERFGQVAMPKGQG